MNDFSYFFVGIRKIKCLLHLQMENCVSTKETQVKYAAVGHCCTKYMDFILSSLLAFCFPVVNLA